MAEKRAARRQGRKADARETIDQLEPQVHRRILRYLNDATRPDFAV